MDQELIYILPVLKKKGIIRKAVSRSEFIKIIEKSTPTTQSEQ
jgi:hypothetical protein